MDLVTKFKNKRILVTGATGFIGSRIIERLYFETKDSQISAMVRNFNKIARISRFDKVNLIKADILNSEEVNKATENIDIILYTIYGNAGTPEQQREVNVKGLDNICKAALKNSVKKIVYLSTISVYGNQNLSVFSEDSPMKSNGEVYTDSKIEAEKLAMEYFHKHNLPITIIRPTVVYGPYSANWTTKYINALRNNTLYLIEDGEGLCDTVYMDNLIDGMFLAAGNERSNGGTYIISDGQPVTWKRFYKYYMDMVGVESIPSLSIKEIKEMKKQRKNLLYNLKGIVKALLNNYNLRRDLSRYELLKYVKSTIKRFIPKEKLSMLAVTEGASSTVTNGDSGSSGTIKFELPTQKQIEFYTAKKRHEINKAKKELGYVPRINIDTGMGLIKTWYDNLF
ncbi:MAG: NAD(P)-dependent oxidoreductase [Candidatus Omnitrophota bacterium]